MSKNKKMLSESKLENLIYECAMAYIKSDPKLVKKLNEKRNSIKESKSKNINVSHKMLFEMVKQSVKESINEVSPVHDKTWDDVGHYFDLDQTTKAYELGNADKHWTDYSNGDDSWDEESYYNDFDEWWKELPQEEKERIYNLMKK